MAYYQGQNDNCWTFAGAQCVTSYLLSTYGIILDFSAVRTHGQGTIPINAGGTFQTFLDNISKVDFMSVDSTASYRVKLQPKDAKQEYISGSKNYWHGNNPYVTYELEEGNHAVAAVRYNSNLTGLACKNSWGTFGQLTDVSFASILEILECEAIEVKKIQLKSVAGKRKAVETNVTPIAFMAGSAWRLIFNELNNFVAEHDDTENFEPDLIFSKLRDIYREHLETEGSAVTVFSCTANNSRYAYDEGYWIDLHSPGRRVEDSPSFRQTISIDAAIPSNVHVGSTANRGRDAVLNA